MDWEQREITIQTRDAGVQTVPAYTYGQLAITATVFKGNWFGGLWSVTHIASGYSLTDWHPHLEPVVALVEQLSDMDFDSYYRGRQVWIRDHDFEARVESIIQAWRESKYDAWA